MREHYGSNRKAAAALGINETQFRRALNGQVTPKASTLGVFERGQRALSARSGFSNADIRLTVTERRPARSKGGGGREREIDARKLRMDDGAADRIRQAYVAGGQDGAIRAFLGEIKERTGHYRRWLAPDGYGPPRRAGGGGASAPGGGGGGGAPSGGGDYDDFDHTPDAGGDGEYGYSVN
jgi:hypothetical protein